MIETDYVWMRPLQAPPAEDPASRPMAYPFNYIVPTAPPLEGVMRKMYPAELGPLSGIHGSGPAPVMMRFDEWMEVRFPSCRPSKSSLCIDAKWLSLKWSGAKHG